MRRKRLPLLLLGMDRNFPYVYLHFNKLILNLLFPISIKYQLFLFCRRKEFLIWQNLILLREGSSEALTPSLTFSTFTLLFNKNDQQLLALHIENKSVFPLSLTLKRWIYYILVVFFEIRTCFWRCRSCLSIYYTVGSVCCRKEWNFLTA